MPHQSRGVAITVHMPSTVSPGQVSGHDHDSHLDLVRPHQHDIANTLVPCSGDMVVHMQMVMAYHEAAVT